jgi:serine/threonine protein kinase
VLGQRQRAREADILAHLRHPNIPRGLDCFVDDVGEFLVMDFVFGEDLSEWIAHTSPGLRPLRRTLGGVFDALAYLHSCRPPIIHRDIEPSNIILTDRQVTCLVDFGRAKRFEPPNLPGFAAALAGLGLIDEYEFVVQARIVGPGPTLIAGLSKSIDLRLVGRLEFASGAVAMRYEPTR